jgi:hypothetical protein
MLLLVSKVFLAPRGSFCNGGGAWLVVAVEVGVPGGASVHPTTTAVATVAMTSQVRRRERSRMRVSREVEVRPGAGQTMD